MKLHVALALLVGVAFSTSIDSPTGNQQWDEYQPIERQIRKRDVQDTTFRPGREYRYFYDAQVMNGIPRASRQNSASRMQAVVVLQIPSQGQVLMKMEHIRLGKLNKRVSNPRVTHPFQFFEPVQVSEEFKNQLEKPVKFNYIDGMIKDIRMESEDSSISKNIKRGILNLLQVNLKEHNSLDSSDAQRTNEPTLTGNSKFFRVMETTLEGECETQYSVVSLPENNQEYFASSSSEENSREQSQSSSRLNITKSINFNRCNRRPEIKYNFRYVSPCKTCDPKYQEAGKYLKPSSLVSYNLAGDRENFMIEAANAESQYTVEFYSEEGSFINVYTNQTLTLYKTSTIGQRFQLQSPVAAESELMYSQRWDVLNEKFMMNPEENQRYPHKPQNFVEKVVQLAKKLVEEAVTEKGISKNSPNKFALLVSALRKANSQDLESIHEKLVSSPPSEYTAHQKKFLKDIIPTATALAGTEPAVKHIVKKIKENQVPKSQKSSLLRQLHNARIVSKNIVNHVKSLCESASVAEEHSVKRACYLSLGTLMKGACGNSEDKLAVDSKFSTHTRCTESHKREFVSMMINKMKESSKWEDKVLYLKALGNAGLDVSVHELEKIIQNKDQINSANARYEAILALRHLSKTMPRKIQRILMPIVMQPREPASIRQAAAYFVVNSQPERSVLEMIAQQLNREPKRQVSAFIFNLMNQMANSTNPCHKQLSADMKLALRFCKNISPSLYDSKFMYSSFQSELRKIGLDTTMFDVMSDNSLFPTALGGSLSSNVFGFFNKDLLTAMVNTEGLDSLIPRIWNTNRYSSFEDVFSRTRHPRSTQTARQTLKNIIQKVGIQARSSSIEPKLYGYVRYEGQEAGYLPISEQLIEQAIEDGTLQWDNIVTSMQTGEAKHFSWHHATMLEDSQYKIPTSLGLPLIVKHKTPIVLKLDGSFKAQLKSGKKVDVVANLKPSVVIKHETTVEVWSPDAPAGARVRGLAQIYSPLKLEAMIDYKKYEAKVNFKPPTSKVQVVHIETQPITFTRPRQTHRLVYKEADEKVVFAEEINRVQKVDKQISSLGMGFHIAGRYTPPQSQPSGNWLPACPLSGPNKLFVYATPSKDNTKEVEIVMTLDASARSSQQLSSSLLKSNYKSSESESQQSSEEYEPEKISSKVHRFGKAQINIVTKGGSKPTTYNLNVHSQMSSNSRFGKLSAKFVRTSAAQSPFKMCLESEVMYPEPPSSRKSVLNKKVIEHAELRWGESCQSNNFVQISGSAERTRKQLQFERDNLESYQECKSSGEESPVACYEYLRQASFMNKYTFSVKYNNVPVSAMNATSKIFRAVKAYYYLNTDVATVAVRNPVNKITASIRFEPRDQSRVNITVKTPRENVTMTDIWTPIRLPRHNVKRSILSALIDEYSSGSQSSQDTYQTRPICRIRSRSVQTFDGLRYQAPMSDCYSVAAKDCSEQNRFAVLVKNDNTNAGNKIVKILTHTQELVLKKSGSEISVRENGEEASVNDMSSEEDASDYKPSTCRKEGEIVACRLRNEGISVYFDGKSVDIKISPWYINNQCGLCGHMNYESSDEFRTPNQESTSDVRQFQQAYTLKDTECEASIPELEATCSSESCDYEPEYRRSSSEESSYEIPSEFHSSNKLMEPRQLNRVVQRMGKLCFSKEPLPTCSMHAHPAQAENREIEYTCIANDAENNMEAADWARNAHQEPISEVRNLPTSFTKKELIPTKCSKY
jgi:hypothetical protein